MDVAADVFCLCQRAAQWSKAYLSRASRESATSVAVDREAHFRSFTQHAKVAGHHGNVKTIYKMKREAAGQPRIKPVPSIMMEDNLQRVPRRPPNDGGNISRSCFRVVLQRLHIIVQAHPHPFSAQDRACMTSTSPHVRCAWQSCARVMAKAMVSMTSPWNFSKLVETRWFPSSALCSTVFTSEAAYPFGFSCTRMCPVWKGKADRRHCSNHRGTQASNVIPSILLEVVNTRAETQIAQFLPDTHCGRQHGSTTFAMHFVRSFVQYAAGGRYNCCLLFAALDNLRCGGKKWLLDVGALKQILRVSWKVLALMVMTSDGDLIVSGVGPFCRVLVWKSNLLILLNVFTQVAGSACKKVAFRRIRRLLLRHGVVGPRVHFRCHHFLTNVCESHT